MKRFVKKQFVFLFALCFMMLLVGCGKKKSAPPVIADGEFIKISSKELGDVDELQDYTVYVTVNTNGTVSISAGEFKHWYSEEACPIVTTKISSEKVEEIKNLITECKFYSMNENVGNRDMTEGEERSITVTTTDKVYSSHGLNVSNRNFNKLYEEVNSLAREQYFEFIENVKLLQQNGKKTDLVRGLMVCDNKQNEVFGNKSIENIEKTKAVNVPMLNTSEISDSDELENMYYVSISFRESAILLAKQDMDNITGEKMQYFLYIDDEYAYTGYINFSLDEKLYIDQRFTKEEADELVNLLNSKRVK